jgi:hypothetical protein
MSSSGDIDLGNRAEDGGRRQTEYDNELQVVLGDGELNDYLNYYALLQGEGERGGDCCLVFLRIEAQATYFRLSLFPP